MVCSTVIELLLFLKIIIIHLGHICIIPILNDAGEDVVNASLDENASKVLTAAIPLASVSLISFKAVLEISVGVLKFEDDKLESLPGLVMAFGLLPKLISSKSSLERDLQKYK